MDIRLISHASVIITSDVSIWTDPWLQGKAFNDSWSLFPEPAMQDAFYETIDYLFISHEHPDHLHFPTLKALPEAFRERVTILYQENNSDKVFKALQRLGFSKMITLPHDKVIGLTENTKVYCYQAGSMDSALAVITPEGTILNLNDCEVNQKDCRRMKRSLGNIRVVLNQFSIAGYSGFKERDKYLPAQARNVLEKMLSNHRDLEAEVTIPFASFIYFSSEDNRYINEYGNKPADAYKFFAKNGQKMDVLYPGDLYEVGSEHDSDPALKRFDDAYSEEMYLPFDVSDTVSLEKISSAFDKLSAELHDRFPKTLLRFLKPVVVEIPDLDKTIIFSIRDRSLSETENADPDLIIKSQPLYFGFSFPYGIQTLGVSARYILNKNFPNWRNHRILFSMNNAEIYLKPRHLFSKKNLAFFRDRLPGAMNQFLYRLKVMR